MALGAERQQVMTLILKRAVTLVVVGVVIGLPAALMAARLVESMLFGLDRVTTSRSAALSGMKTARSEFDSSELLG